MLLPNQELPKKKYGDSESWHYPRQCQPINSLAQRWIMIGIHHEYVYNYDITIGGSWPHSDIQLWLSIATIVLPYFWSWPRMSPTFTPSAHPHFHPGVDMGASRKCFSKVSRARNMGPSLHWRMACWPTHEASRMASPSLNVGFVEAHENDSHIYNIGIQPLK